MKINYIIPSILLGLTCGQQAWTQQNSSLTVEPTESDSTKKNKKVELKFSGFIRHDAMYDSRQTVDVREAAVILWSEDLNLDADGKDINAAPKFQMLSILSRFGVMAYGPTVLGAKTSGYLEGDFFGNAEAGINEFRLRHGWIRFDWKKTQIGLGQYWHPLTIPEMFPGVVNFSGGAPYMPYNRNPQIRLTQKLNPKFNLIAALVTQRDFTSNTAPYINSAKPAGDLQFNYKSKKLLVGIAGHYEIIRPKLSSGTPAKVTTEELHSATGMVFAKLETKPVIIRAEAVYGQNATSFIMLGGYVGYTAPNETETFRTMETESFWIDLAGNYKSRILPGFFAGFSRNLGVKNPLEGTGIAVNSYGFATTVTGIGAGAGKRTINYIYRVAPRLEAKFDQVKFGLEAEYSVAEWGDADDRGLAVANKSLIPNWRFIFATTFSF